MASFSSFVCASRLKVPIFACSASKLSLKKGIKDQFWDDILLRKDIPLLGYPLSRTKLTEGGNGNGRSLPSE
jgi:hypothetical protein